jgi:hypothetical protein
MKMRNQIFVLTIISFSMIFISCSDLKDDKDLPTATSDDLQFHTEEWADPNSANSHAKFIQNNGWDMRGCRTCHGSDYTGGTSGKSCYDCHNNPGGPQNCATCHGMPPPPALDGSTAYTAHGVGAHAIHLTGGGAYSSYSMNCQGCHHLPTSIYDPAHIDANGHAEVVMTDPLANLTSGGVTPVPTYDINTLKCSNTFCHGTLRLTKAGLPSDSVYIDTVIVGNNYVPQWNGGPAEKNCGTCHGNPPTGHKTYTQACSFCHEDVTTASGKLKHMNGKIDLAGGVVRNFR